ncbi:MAG: hypothetical protein J5737_06635 [Bacteroidales bacterium]|nr:hypothetical protein [Bacteroidales bacterium]
MTFESLVGRIIIIQDALQAQAAHAVNLSLTARNWLVGYYIVEFEQHGDDRAKYGDKLLKNLAKKLNRRGLGERRLYEYRLTYQVYPQLGNVIADYLFRNGNDVFLRLPSAKSVTATNLIEKEADSKVSWPLFLRGVVWGVRGTPLRSGPSQRLLRPRGAGTCIRRAPPPILVRGWTSPRTPHTTPRCLRRRLFRSVS